MHWHSKAFHHRMAFPLDTTGFNGAIGTGMTYRIEHFESFSFRHGFFLFKPVGFLALDSFREETNEPERQWVYR